MELLVLYILLFIPAAFAQPELDIWFNELSEHPSFTFLRPTEDSGGIKLSRKLPVVGITVAESATVGVCDRSMPYCINDTIPGPGPYAPQPAKRRRRRQDVPANSCPNGWRSTTCSSPCPPSDFGSREEQNFTSDTAFRLLPECFDIRQVQSLVPTRSAVVEGTVAQVRFRSSGLDPAPGSVQAGCTRTVDFTVFTDNRRNRATTIMFYFKSISRNLTVPFALNFTSRDPITIGISAGGILSFASSGSTIIRRADQTVPVTDEEFHHFALTAEYTQEVEAPTSFSLAIYIDGIYGGGYAGQGQLPDLFSIYGRGLGASFHDLDIQDVRQYSFLWTERRLFETFSLNRIGLHLYPSPDCYCPQSHPLVAASGRQCRSTRIIPEVSRVSSATDYSINSVFFQAYGSTWLSAPNVPKATIDISFAIEYSLFGTSFSIPNPSGLRNLKISITVDGTNFAPVLYMSENCQRAFGMMTWDNTASIQYRGDGPLNEGDGVFPGGDGPPIPGGAGVQPASSDAPLTFDEAGSSVFAPLCTTFSGHMDVIQIDGSKYTRVNAIWATFRVLRHLNSKVLRTFRASSLRLEMTAEKTSSQLDYLSLARVEIMGSCFCFERGACQDDGIRRPNSYLRQNQCLCQQNSTGTNCEICSGENTYQVNGACYSCNCDRRYTEGNSGACDSRGQCDCISGWNRELGGLTCKPYVESVVPAFGPAAGGTEVTIVGGGLSRARIHFQFGDAYNITQGSDKIVFTTTPAPPFLRLPAKVGVSLDDEDLQHNFVFEYRPNPNLTSLDGYQRTTYRGGLNITLVGENMDSVYRPRLLVRYFDANGQVVQFKLLATGVDVDFISTVCANINETVTVCPTPDFRNTIDSMFFEDFYQNYKRDVLGPILESGTPPPFPDIPSLPPPSSLPPTPLPPPSSLPPTPLPPTPSAPVKKRRKRQAIASGPPRSFVLGVVFDGYRNFVDLAQVDRLQDFSIIQVHSTPVVRSLAGEDGVIDFDPESDVFLRVSGSGMNFGATAEEYVVEVGKSMCSVTSLSSNTLVCRPPSEKPAVDPNNYRKVDGEELPHVKVTLGNFDADLGFIKYPSTGLSIGAIAGIVIGVILFVGLVAALVVFILWRRNSGKEPTSKFKIYRDSDQDGAARYISDPAHAPEDTLFKEIDPGVLDRIKRCTIPDGNVKLNGLAGKGNFGMVYKGELKCPKSGKWLVVAVKTLRGTEELDAQKLEGFLKEAMIMLDFTHENVLSLLGVCMSDNQPMVVLPFMQHGDLKGLVKNQDNNFTVGDLLHFCLQISIGMEYLAKNKFVHRDLAARNIMVNSDFIAKVADFGLSQDVYEKEYYRVNDKTKPLPVKWMSPECMTEGKFTQKSDVWAYGVVMWEIFTRGANPYPSVNNYEIKNYVTSGKRLDKPSGLDDLVYEIMVSCWNADTEARPPFSHLMKELSELLGGGEEQDNYEREYTKDIKKDYYYSRSEDSEECVTYVESDKLLEGRKHSDSMYLDVLSGDAAYQANTVKA